MARRSSTRPAKTVFDLACWNLMFEDVKEAEQARVEQRKVNNSLKIMARLRSKQCAK